MRDRLFVANSGSNSVSVIDDGKVVETIKTSLDPKALVGSTPDALAISHDGKRLYVANADNNDVAVIDISEEGRLQDSGLHSDRLVSRQPWRFRPTTASCSWAPARVSASPPMLR